MACEMCEHCQGPVSGAQVVVREGFSYHRKCHKCYVCSETNLTNADIFKGVIFCSSCSQRIFQGCSTAKKTKTTKPKRPRSRSHRRRERVRAQDRRTEVAKVQNGIIELAGLGGSTDSRSNSDELKKPVKLSKTLAISTELALQVGKQIYEENKTSIEEKKSADMGVITDITQELLKQMNCPVVNDHKTKSISPRCHTKQTKAHVRHRNKNVCSDLRVAELGVSTEIANMTLKNKSELPVIIKSESPFSQSLSMSILNHESDSSDKTDTEKWLEFRNTSIAPSMRSNWKDKRLGSILKIPYKSFKRNILNRSSLISVLLSGGNSDFSLVKKIKKLLHEEIIEHQRCGVKKLYSTIMRRKRPLRLGWSRMVANDPVKRLSRTVFHHKRCKHFRTSHSYRCMRAKVMKLAGPTKSELAGFRMKMKSFVAPAFMKNIIEYNNKYAAIMMSQACGSEIV